MFLFYFFRKKETPKETKLTSKNIFLQCSFFLVSVETTNLKASINMLYKSLLTFLALRQARKRAAVKLLKLQHLKSTIRHYVTCDCLKPPSGSNWNYVYEKDTDTNFIALTSLTRGAFNTLRFSVLKAWCIVRFSVSGQWCYVR